MVWNLVRLIWGTIQGARCRRFVAKHPIILLSKGACLVRNRIPRHLCFSPLCPPRPFCPNHKARRISFPGRLRGGYPTPDPAIGCRLQAPEPHFDHPWTSRSYPWVGRPAFDFIAMGDAGGAE